MADGLNETPRQGDSEYRAAREPDAVREAVEEVDRRIEETEANPQQRERLEQELRDELTRLEALAIEVGAAAERNVQAPGTVPENKKEEAQKIQVSVAKVLRAVEKGVIKPPEKSQAVLSRLARQDLSAQASTSLYNFVTKYLREDIAVSQPGQSQTSFEQALDTLRARDPGAAAAVRSALIAEAATLGLTSEQASQKFAGEVREQPAETRTRPQTMVETLRQRGVDIPEDVFAEDYYERGMVREFFKEPQDYRVWRALLNIEDTVDPQTGRVTDRGFRSYVNETREEISAKYPGDEQKIRKETSEKITRDVVRLFTRLYETLDNQHPEKLYEEIEREGYSASIEVAKGIFARRLIRLTNSLVSDENYEQWKNFFYREVSIADVNVREVQKQFPDKKEPLTQYVIEGKVVPLLDIEMSDAPDFIRSILVHVRTTEGLMKYTHNVNALFHRRGSADQGFWGQIAKYSEEFTTGSIDELMVLPDGWLIMEAHNLYRKYLEEELVKSNWMHQPQLLTARRGNFVNEIQRMVFEDLKRMYASEFGDTPDEQRKEEWRVRRAVGVALGLSRGVFLSEVEPAAWADPLLDPLTGDPTHISYGTNEADPYTAFNPQHHFLRWQHETHKKGALLFALTNFDRKKHRFWDHYKAFEEMKKYRETFYRGSDWLRRKDPDERRFYEILPGLTRVGSLLFRGAWRLNAYDYWMVKYPGVEGTGSLAGQKDLLSCFKALENIGYDVTFHFSEGDILGNWNFLLDKDPAVAAERQKLFEYVYNKYIRDPQGRTGQSLDDYLRQIRPRVEEKVDRLIKRGDLDKSARQDWIIVESYKTLMYRGLAGLLLQHVPTKLIKLERNRLAEDGVRAWDKVRQRLGWGNTAEGLTRMDVAMRNLSMVESLLRRKMSKAMREHVERQGMRKSLHDFDSQTNRFVVTEDLIREELARMGIESADVISLFRTIHNFVLEGNLTETFIDKFAGKLIKNEKIRVGYDSQGRGEDINEFRDFFPMQIGNDDIDNTFLNWSNTGAGALNRAVREVAEAEMQVFTPLKELWDALPQVAIDPNRDISPLIKPLKVMHEHLQSIHDKLYAIKVMDQVASGIIAYFRKDTIAKVFPFRFARFGKVNSIAAELVGPFKGVWEWEAKDIHNFLVELQRQELVPHYPRELWQKAPDVKARPRLFGLFRPRVEYHPATKYYARNLADRAGARWWHLGWEYINKYLPLIIGYLLWQALSKAFKEEYEGQR